MLHHSANLLHEMTKKHPARRRRAGKFWGILRSQTHPRRCKIAQNAFSFAKFSRLRRNKTPPSTTLIWAECCHQKSNNSTVFPTIGTTRRGVSIPRNSDLSPAGRGMESVKLSPIRQRHRGLPAPRVVPADALIAGAASVTGLAEMESRECQDSINSARHRGHPAPQAARPPAPDAQNVQSRRARRETYRPTASNNIILFSFTT